MDSLVSFLTEEEIKKTWILSLDQNEVWYFRFYSTYTDWHGREMASHYFGPITALIQHNKIYTTLTITITQLWICRQSITSINRRI